MAERYLTVLRRLRLPREPVRARSIEVVGGTEHRVRWRIHDVHGEAAPSVGHRPVPTVPMNAAYTSARHQWRVRAISSIAVAWDMAGR